MASETENITLITRGNDITLKFNITTSRDLGSARLTIKRRIKDADDAATTMNKVVTTTPGADGSLTNPGGGAPSVASFILLKTETDNFTAGREYPYDVEVFDEDDLATTPIGGTFIFEERVRIAVG